ncbi:hypothetical protein [Fodinicola feengrottensis]|uniref:hypothetical protein n=1 Tax=Fodinicola feengrottensis TaxID=435914 RepID=UPI0024413E0A|nr:hypothetical protein [Fodinicola feengrottensis]
MIIDVHSHFFRDHSHFSESFVAQSSRSRTEPVDLRVRWEDYLATAPGTLGPSFSVPRHGFPASGCRTRWSPSTSRTSPTG